MDWGEVELGTLVNRKIGYGIVQPGENVSFGIPVIKVSNIISGLNNIHNLDRTNPEIANKYQRTTLKGGELVISLVGSVGKTAIVPKSFAGSNLVRATGLIDIEDPLITQWVKYYIDSNKGQAYINNNLNTTVQATLNIKLLSEMPIPIPDRKIIEKTVTILSSLDAKIENNNKINANLEAQAAALFKSWFVDFEPFRDGEFVESELGMIPKGWKVGTLNEICITNKRSSSKIKSTIEYLDTGSIICNKIESTQILDPLRDKIPSRAKRCVSEGDIIYSSVRPNQLHYGILINPPMNLVVSTGFIVVTANQSAYRYFIYQYLIQNEIVLKLQAIGEQSVSTYPSINAIDIENLLLVLPPYDVLEIYSTTLSSYYQLIEQNNKENHRLSSLRDTLLPKLMSGEIDLDNLSVM